MMEPTLPAKCGWCEEQPPSPRTLTEAIKAGWHIIVLATQDYGTVQMVACPKHKANWEKAVSAILKTGTPPPQAKTQEEVEAERPEGSQVAMDIKSFVDDTDKIVKSGKKLLDRLNKPREVPPDDR
jgi:hypothetical protein